MATDFKGLDNFRNKLQKYSNIKSGITNEIAREIARRGEQIAREEYAGMDKVKVSYQTLGGGISRVIAERDGLSYIEFGTGDVGKNSNYPEQNLPKEGVPITGKWDYYYLPSDSKDTVNGERGWWWGKTFITGRPAGMQMYHTSQRLKSEMLGVAKNKIKGEGVNV